MLLSCLVVGIVDWLLLLLFVVDVYCLLGVDGVVVCCRCLWLSFVAVVRSRALLAVGCYGCVSCVWLWLLWVVVFCWLLVVVLGCCY